jgi:glycosyltransferase involved in cell wall biosynthesis
MSVSIVIPTYNGAKKIPLLLNALLAQSNQGFEIVVVIDGSTDDTDQVLKHYKNRFSDFKVITQLNSGRSKVRNRGVKESKGDLIIFYDDDIIPFSNSVMMHINFHQTNQEKVILVGNLKEEQNSSQTDIQNYKAFLSEKWMAPYPSGVSELTLETLFFSAANCSIKRIDFNNLNGFDERLTDAEDHDLAFRALNKGIKVFFDKDNLAIHNDIISARSYLKRLRAYNRAHKQWNQIHDAEVGKKNKSIYKRVIYAFFGFEFWLRLIDYNVLKYAMPKALRFKFYDVVLQSLSIEYPNVYVS